MNAKALFFRALSPIHPGTGQGVGVIDQPIIRERATNLPFIPASSIKGVFRDLIASENSDKAETIFGPSISNSEGNYELSTGMAQFTDARLLLLPVRSLSGVFAWITSPFLLRRLNQDFAMIGKPITNQTKLTPGSFPAENALTISDSCLIIPRDKELSSLVLEDLELLVKTDHPYFNFWKKWLGDALFPQNQDEQDLFKQHFAIVHDDVLSFFVENATEVNARIRINANTKTADAGALWYEEALPAETVLVSLLQLSMSPKASLNVEEASRYIEGAMAEPIQFGGGTTIGRGLCSVYSYQDSK